MLWILKKIPYARHLFINNKCYPFWKAMLNISNFLYDLSVSWRQLKDNIFKSSLIIFPFKYVCISQYSLLLKKKKETHTQTSEDTGQIIKNLLDFLLQALNLDAEMTSSQMGLLYLSLMSIPFCNNQSGQWELSGWRASIPSGSVFGLVYSSRVVHLGSRMEDMSRCSSQALTSAASFLPSP